MPVTKTCLSSYLAVCPGVHPTAKETLNKNEVNCVCPCLSEPLTEMSAVTSETGCQYLRKILFTQLSQSWPYCPLQRINHSLWHCRFFFKDNIALLMSMRCLRALPRRNQIHQTLLSCEKEPSTTVKFVLNAGFMVTMC